MSDANGQPSKPVPVEKLFEQAMLLLPGLTRRAFRRCNHPASPDDIERCGDRVRMLLWGEGKYKPLCALKEEAKLPAYLFKTVYYEVIRFLKEEKRKVPLEDLSQERIEQVPTQYEAVLWGERMQKLDEAIAKRLTEHERKLLALMREGKQTAEITQELGITKGTASVEKSNLLKKLQGWMDE